MVNPLTLSRRRWFFYYLGAYTNRRSILLSGNRSVMLQQIDLDQVARMSMGKAWHACDKTPESRAPIALGGAGSQ